MVTDKIKQLADYQNKVQALKHEIEKERTGALAHLHEKFGFASARELIKAIREAAGLTKARRGGKGRRRKYSRITAELREQIKAALQAGKTGGQVAAEFGISLPSVYNIKKKSGLVKARKGK
jgi:hypothetical protein